MAEDPQKKEILAPPKMTILSDHPILREEDANKELDSFTLSSRLGAVYDIIRHKNTRPPLAVAIYGDWGTGKSSAMRWLSDALEQWSEQDEDERKGHARVRTVWFDPWKYTKREDVWRGLISEVILESLPREGAPIKRVLRAVGNFGHSLGRAFLNTLSSIELTAGVEGDGSGAKTTAEVSANLEAFSKILENYRERSEPEKAYLNEFEKALRSWVEDSLKDDERMVLFIDDLDRCLPGVVLEVLEALKLYLNIPQLIFVVGLDRDVVESVVEKHYADQGLGKAKAKHYLDKMFQVEVEIPPSQTLMAGYITGQIEAMDAASEKYWSKSLEGWKAEYKTIIEEKIADLAAHNPREVKRLLNSTLLRATAAARDGNLGGDESMRFTQGCQVYLIHCFFKKYVPDSGGLLRENEILRFLKAWSDFIAAYPSYERPGGRSEGEERGGLADEDARDVESPKSSAGKAERKGDAVADAAYKKLIAAVPRYHDGEFKGQSIPLLDQGDARDLLVIPFSPDVAAAAVIDGEDGDSSSDKQDSGKQADGVPDKVVESAAQRSPQAEAQDGGKRATPSDAAESLASMPAFVRSKIARSLNKSVESLRADDLSRVRRLSLGFGDIADLSSLSGLTALQILDLFGTEVTDVSPLSGLTGLQFLDLSDTEVTDVSPLSGLTALLELNLTSTKVTDVSALSGLTALQELTLWNTQVTDLSPLSGLTALEYLDLDGMQVTDLSPLSGLTALRVLDLRNTQLTDAALKQLDRCKQLTDLRTGGTQITDAALKRFLDTREPG